MKITPDGRVKVLDFGLAKSLRDAPESSDSSSSTTAGAGGTRDNVILGTPSYMSPEQARGKSVDERTDIWSFGCVLFEMLSGRPAFRGETITDTLAAVVGSEPNWSALSPETPAVVRLVVAQCLQKELPRRFRNVADARLLLVAEEGPALPTKRPSRPKSWGWPLSAVAFFLTTLSLSVGYLIRPTPDAPEMRLEMTLPPIPEAGMALSPDGRLLAFVSTSEDGITRLSIRPLDAVASRPLSETEDASYPFWSPDSRSIGFFASGKLKRIDADGGSLQTLASAMAGRGGAWSAEGTIVFAPSFSSALYRVSETGGDPAPVTQLDEPHQGSHRAPYFLPDGRHVLYYALGTPEGDGVYVASLDGGKPRRLFAERSSTAYVPPGMLLFVREGSLMAQRFDDGKLALAGEPLTLTENVGSSNDMGDFSASANGILVYRTRAVETRQLTWLDRRGKATGTFGDSDRDLPANPELAPDGARVALDRTVNGNEDLWLVESARGAPTRFTFEPGRDSSPIWSPDGSRIVFASNRKGGMDLYQKLSNGAGTEEPLLEIPANQWPVDWSPDGRSLLYRHNDRGFDLWVLPLSGDREPFAFVNGDFHEKDGQFSPDGRWVAYGSSETGRSEVYVRSFPAADGKQQVSTEGGAQPRWRRDGRELFFIGLNGTLLAAPITLAAEGKALQVGTAVTLFEARSADATTARGVGLNKHQYSVSPDGQRFLVNLTTEVEHSPLTVVLNWTARLSR